mgnify:CR=1 FL=1
MLLAFLRWLWSWIAKPFTQSRRPPPYSLSYIESDELPDLLEEQVLLVAREAGELWVAGLVCPCGCSRRIEIMLLKGVKPRWDLIVENSGRPTLRPSVWAKGGCRSHFWLRDGQIVWCREEDEIRTR